MSRDQVQAAAASRGSSSNAIHDLFATTAAELGLQGDLLDFGAGTGHLAARLASTGRFRSVAAVDLLMYPGRAPSIAWLQANLERPLPLREASFDVVIAAEVVEHLENPRAVAREWARLLRPGGMLLASTPNNESLRSLLSLVWRGHHVAFSEGCYPAHITALVRRDLERVLSEAGFEAPTFRFLPRGAVPWLTRLDWGRLSLGALRGVRFSDNILACARRR